MSKTTILSLNFEKKVVNSCKTFSRTCCQLVHHDLLLVGVLVVLSWNYHQQGWLLRILFVGATFWWAFGEKLDQGLWWSCPRRSFNPSWESRGNWNSIPRGSVLMWVPSCPSVSLTPDFVLVKTCTAWVSFMKMLRCVAVLVLKYSVLSINRTDSTRPNSPVCLFVGNRSYCHSFWRCDVHKGFCAGLC